MLLYYLLVAPAIGSVELADKGLAVLDTDLVNAVLKAVGVLDFSRRNGSQDSLPHPSLDQVTGQRSLLHSLRLKLFDVSVYDHPEIDTMAGLLVMSLFWNH